jgi:hypothetical protein
MLRRNDFRHLYINKRKTIHTKLKEKNVIYLINEERANVKS